MFGALSAEIIQVYSPHLLAEGEVLLYGGSEIYYNSDTLVPISVEAQSIFSFEWRGLSNDNSLDVTIVRDSIGFSGTVIDRGSGYSALNLPEGIYYEIQCFSDGSIASHPFVITN